MSASKRGDLVSKTARELPGPGNYEPAPSKSVAFTMGGKPRDTQDSSKPGPGHYDPKLFLTKDQSGQAFRMP